MAGGRAILVAIIAACAWAAVWVPPAGAATQIGQTFAPVTSCGAASTYLQTTSPGGQYAAPSPGVITAWSFQANATPPTQIKLKVARPAGGNLYTTVGESPPPTTTASATRPRTSARPTLRFNKRLVIGPLPRPRSPSTPRTRPRRRR